MKTFPKIAGLCVLTLAVFAAPAYPQNTTLDSAIADASGFFIPNIPQRARVAVIHFDASTGRLSDYVFEEVWKAFEDSRRFVMVDRVNIDRIETEINYQLRSGSVDDGQLVSITSRYGAQFLVYGQIRSFGADYRMTVTVTDVEKASSSQRSLNVRHDGRLASLLNAPPDEEVQRAVSLMARTVEPGTVIAIGRISFAGTQSVSGLSLWLKNNILSNAQRHGDRFRIATEGQSSDFAVATRGLAEAPAPGSPVRAVVTGTFSPLDNGADVFLQLVSTEGGRNVLSSTRFFISAAELERRMLSLLPDRGTVATSQAEFERRQQAVAPFSGATNGWAFTVTLDNLDGIFHEGDSMTLRIFSERDSYFQITHVDVYGNKQVVYPILPGDDNFIRAGRTRQIPDNGVFMMTPPFGEEMILVSAYDRPFTVNRQQGTESLSAESVSRGLRVESAGNRGEMTPSATGMVPFTVLPRR